MIGQANIHRQFVFTGMAHPAAGLLRHTNGPDQRGTGQASTGIFVGIFSCGLPCSADDDPGPLSEGVPAREYISTCPCQADLASARDFTVLPGCDAYFRPYWRRTDGFPGDDLIPAANSQVARC